MDSPEISIVIPAYNEEGRLASALRSTLDYFNHRGEEFEVIVFDDGSVDRTSEVARKCAEWPEAEGRIRLIREPLNRGKGFGVRSGMLASRGRIALMTDADLSTPIAEFDRLERILREGDCDLTFGSRDTAGARIEVRQPRYRELLGKAFNRFIRLSAGVPFRDTQCGFKLFRMATCRALFACQRLHGFAFDVELLFIARKWDLKVEEVPVTWRHCEGSKVSFSRHAPSILIDLARLQLNNARGAYRKVPAGTR